MITKPFKGASLKNVTQGFHEKHRAIDWFPSTKFYYGTPLVTPEKVKIKTIFGNNLTNDNKELYNGYYVWMIGLETGFEHLYHHLQPIILANVGDVIERGKIIGFMGNSGNVFSGDVYVPLEDRLLPSHAGTHLHQSVFKNGVSFDPITIMDLETEPTYTYSDFITAYMGVLARISKLIS